MLITLHNLCKLNMLTFSQLIHVWRKGYYVLKIQIRIQISWLINSKINNNFVWQIQKSRWHNNSWSFLPFSRVEISFTSIDCIFKFFHDTVSNSRTTFFYRCSLPVGFFFNIPFSCPVCKRWHLKIASFFVFQYCGLEMDKENGKSNEGNSGSSKVSNSQDPTSLLDAASLFGGKCFCTSQGLILPELFGTYSHFLNSCK